ncbi:MAG: hypothetical protein ACI8TX_002976 [Hyphomicrobiaceae bacterium]|jgi:uncharacterized protein (DUF427 family)
MQTPEELARSMWRWRGQERPPFAEAPVDGQESVWDYPRPPRLVKDHRTVVVRFADLVIAETTNAVRVLETAGPPTFYLPPNDVRPECIEAAPGGSHCEWKGVAAYWSVVANGQRARNGAWSYPEPKPAFASLAGWLSFYPARFDCRVNGERVRPQPGQFYAGWVTDEIVGPFKGEPGSSGW